MLGTQKVHARLFYEFDLETHIPTDHLLRGIDRFLDLNDLHEEMRSFYSHTGRPSIDPGLMIRMLVAGYVMGLRSERRLCQEVHLNLAYRWFCRLGLGDKVPDHSSFSKLRNGKFRDSDIFRLGLSRLRLRGPMGVKDEFTLATTAQNLRKLAKLCPKDVALTPIG